MTKQLTHTHTHIGMIGQYFILPFYIYPFQIRGNGLIAFSLSFFGDSLKFEPHLFRRET